MEPKDWLFLAVGVSSLVLLHKQNKILSKGQTNMDKYNPAPPSSSLQHWKGILGPRWPLLAMGALAVVSWIPYFVTPAKERVVSYGMNGNRIYAQVDSEGLGGPVERLFMIALRRDDSVNYKTVTTITRSATLPISTPYTFIEAVMPNDFTQLLLKNPDSIVTVFVFKVSQDFPFESVKSISDAEKYGAKQIEVGKGFGGVNLHPM